MKFWRKIRPYIWPWRGAYTITLVVVAGYNFGSWGAILVLMASAADEFN